MDNLRRHMDVPIEFGSTSWYVLMVLAGLAVGAAIALAKTIFDRDDGD